MGRQGRLTALAALVLVVVACRTTTAKSSAVDLPSTTASTTPPVATTTSSSGVATAAPLAIGNRLVDASTGATVGKLAVSQYEQAVPVRDGTSARWRVGTVLFDALGTAIGTTELVHVEPGAVVRQEPTSAVRWRTPLAGARSVRTPDAVVVGGTAVVSVDDTFHAFDDATGKPTWTARGPTDRLATDGTLVFATDCRSGKVPGRPLRALRPSDGKEMWRSPLEDEMDPDAIEVGPRQIVVRDASHHVTFVFDRAGHELARMHETIWSVAFQPTGLLVFGDKRVVYLDDAGAVRWSRAALANTFVAHTDVVATSAGMLFGNYGAISDSGVHLVLVDPSTGATKWETRVPGLGVGHSEYLHTAYLEARGGKVFVVSQGSGGAFFERVELGTGKREQRCDPTTATCIAP